MTWRLSTEFQVEIVGVIEDIRQARVASPPYPEVFMDYRQVRHVQEQLNASKQRTEQMAFGFMAFGVRTRGNPNRFLPNVHQIVKSVDPNAGIDAIQSMDKMVGASTARQRFYAAVLGIFAGVAALLASIGIYGVLAYSVVQRTQEIGVRMALGAERRQVITLILKRGIIVSGVGIMVGLIGAAAGAKYLESMLFGIQPRDPWTFATVALSFSAVAIVASYLPARKATLVDPMVALRVE
jgi:putative ABC transport system permease protein